MNASWAMNAHAARHSRPAKSARARAVHAATPGQRVVCGQSCARRPLHSFLPVARGGVVGDKGADDDNPCPGRTPVEATFARGD